MAAKNHAAIAFVLRRLVMLNRHKKIERNSILMLIGIVIVVAIGGLIEIVPLFRVETTIPKIQGMRPYSPLELMGQNIYIREGCSNCHKSAVYSRYQLNA